MRIVSWNCNGKFRNKFDNILKLDADIYIIQECENPDKNIGVLKSVPNGKIDEFNKYRSFAKNYLWYGAELGDDKGIELEDEMKTPFY